MATVDDKVVAVSFESSKFESGVSKTINAINKLKEALHFPDAGKNLQNINTAAKKIDLSHVSRGIDDISSKLGALRLAAVAVFANLASKALAAGTRFAKAFTLDPIKAGFSEYTTNLNAVQTILANTQASGAKLKDVNQALKVLNDYSDKTIYNFSQMAKNIGTFTAAGVDLDTATGAIKGIANLAALSGSNAEQASTAMYQLSQAIAAGRVSLQDWNSVVNAGMGGTVFQRALAQTAQAMGTLKDGSVKLVGPMKNVSIAGESFRESVSAKPGEKSWLTSKVLTNTLKQFTGDLSAAQLKAQGFNDAQIKSIQQTATTAQKAATEVKTLQGVLDTAKETAGSGWAQTWQIIFGDFGEAKQLFTGLSNAINGFIKSSADARNKVLQDWKDLGGRTLLIEAIKNVFEALGAVIKPIKEAFRDIFPATTGKDLFELTKRFKEFSETLRPSPETLNNLKRTFRGLFALLDIGKQIIVGIFTVFRRLFGTIGDGSGSFLEITAKIGDFLVKVDLALKKSGALQNFFERLGDILSTPIKMLGEFASALSGLFGGFSSGGFSGQIDGMSDSMTTLQKVMEKIGEAWDKFIEKIGLGGEILKPIVEAYVGLFQMLPDLITQAAQNMNFEAILAVIRTGLLGGIFLMFKKFLGGGPFVQQLTKGFAGIGGGVLGNISGAFGSLEGSMKALQTNLKAKTLKEIAIAIALLTASVVALSFVNPDRLTSAMTAITVGFGQLLGAMAILEKVSTSTGFIKLPFITASLILLAGALDLLSVAVIALSFLSWEQLAKGLGAIGFLLAAISVATGPLSANSAGMIRASIGITGIAIALNLLALAVRQFANMSMSELAKGLGAVAVGLDLISVSMRAMPKGMIATGAGLIAVAAGLRILANVVEKFSVMNWEEIAKGMSALAISLGIIVVAMRLFPKGMIKQAAGLILVAAALQGIVRAVQGLGGMSITDLAKGLISLAASLGILAAALYLMEAALPGAAALAVAAAGLSLLAPALVVLGKQSWEQIVKGLVALASAIAIIGAAGLVLDAAIPGLLGFGAALLLIGAGMALAGAGIALVGVGLSALAVAGPVAFGVLIQAFVQFQKALIENAKLLVLGILEVVNAFADSAPKFVDALVKIVKSLVDAIVKASPEIAKAMDALIKAALTVITNNDAAIIAAGFKILVDLLKGIRDNIGQITNIVVDIVKNLLNGLARNASKIISAGANVLIALLRGIANNLANVAKSALSIIVKFVDAIANNLGKVATAGLSVLTKFLRAIADNIGKAIKAGTDVIVNFIKGVGDAGPRIVSAATTVIIKFINALSKNSVRLADAGATAVINFLNGIAKVIRQREPELLAAGANIGLAIVQGLAQGVRNGLGNFRSALLSLLPGPLKKFAGKLGLGSPSKVFYEFGQYIVEGLALGITDSNGAHAAVEETANGIISIFNTIFQTASPSKVMYGIGRDVMAGFAQGLKKGTEDDIRGAFGFLNEELAKRVTELRQQIREEQGKIRELRKGKEDKEELKEIIALNQALAGHRDQLAAVTRAQTLWRNGMAGNRTELIANAQKLAALTEKIETIKQAIKDFKEQYSQLPQIVTEVTDETTGDTRQLTGAEQLAQYTQALAQQIEDTTKYTATLQKLKAMGLDDATYKMLLEQGTAGQQFAQALVDAGPEAINKLKSLDSNLSNAAEILGTNAAAELYNAGVQAAEGLVKGLESQKAKLEKLMEDLADAMVKRIKKKLKIKSPSEVFAELGKQSMEGMAKGFEDSSSIVSDAVEQAAEDALTAMRESMSDISGIVNDELNPNPVITPILDLTQVKSKTAELAALTNVVPITAAVSFGQASAISSAQMQSDNDALVAATGGTSIKFEQNNYSPEALSTIEIYRQTRNSLSLIKSELAPS